MKRLKLAVRILMTTVIVTAAILTSPVWAPVALTYGMFAGAIALWEWSWS